MCLEDAVRKALAGLYGSKYFCYVVKKCSFHFCLFSVSTGRHRVSGNVFGLGVRAGFQGTKLSTQH